MIIRNSLKFLPIVPPAPAVFSNTIFTFILNKIIIPINKLINLKFNNRKKHF